MFYEPRCVQHIELAVHLATYHTSRTFPALLFHPRERFRWVASEAFPEIVSSFLRLTFGADLLDLNFKWTKDELRTPDRHMELNYPWSVTDEPADRRHIFLLAQPKWWIGQRSYVPRPWMARN